MAENKYVIFRLANESYGIPIESVERILAEQSVTRLPKTPKMFLGVFDLRGETVPTIDLRTRFEFPETTEPCNFVVVTTSSGRCALRVDEVEGIVNLEEKDIEDNPQILKRKEDEFVCGVAKHKGGLIVLLDADHVVPSIVAKHMEKKEKLALAA